MLDPEMNLEAWIGEVLRILPPGARIAQEEREWLSKAHQRGDGALTAALAILGGAWRLENMELMEAKARNSFVQGG